MEKYFTNITEELIKDLREETNGFDVSDEALEKGLQKREFIGLEYGYISAFSILFYLQNDYEYTSNQYFLKLAKEKYPKKKKSIYDLEIGDEYWFISEDGGFFRRYIGDSASLRIFKNRLNVKSAFLTEQEAVKERSKRQATARIEKALVDLGCELGFVPNEYNYYFALDFDGGTDWKNNTVINYGWDKKRNFGALMFRLKNSLEIGNFINNHEADIKLMLGVE